MSDRPRVLVGKNVRVRTAGSEPTYFTQTHRARLGSVGVVHAVVRTESRDNPLLKVKFPPDNSIVFFRLSELDVVRDL